MTDWTETYRPTTLSDLRGNDKARESLHSWARSWGDHREAAVIHGSPGVGKTSAAHALANDMGWDVMELNASDSRTRDQIEKVAGGAAMNRSLTGTGRQLVILDEADNLHQHKDRGGARAMTDLVKSANQPIVLIANDYYDMSRGLRNACREIEFRDVSARSILPALRDICRREGVQYDDEALERIAERNSGDLRGAINDLQAVAEGRDHLTVADISTGSRDRSVGIFEFLDGVLKEEGAQEALQLAYDAEENPEDLLQWVEDKVPMVYEGQELADAYEFISNADRWQGRVRATQNYSYWRYISDNVAAGVASVRRSTRGGWTRYGGYPYRSSRDATRDHVAQQIAEAEGVSIATARREYLPFLASMVEYCKPRELAVAIAARYELDAEHLAYVSGSGKDTNKVQEIIEDAERLREEQAVEHSGGAFAPGERELDDDAVEVEITDDGGEADADAEDDGQATLFDSDDGAADDDAVAANDAEDSEEDDQQSGLSDFM
ncbi:replication factor C large subunit [Salinirubellus salinus]|uniref:Replication factor C large subunit n=1 Tax=Salinirubellus salinus TaxID=1364945 RepID=A0A9E7UBX1_9EURY|nr:replication factor C large subunit [Salinirubellus salinus]UWM55607.1 replication factor C large subunit [Salinirubellus salinus]